MTIMPIECSSSTVSQFLGASGALTSVVCFEASKLSRGQLRLRALILNPYPGMPNPIEALANTEYVKPALDNGVNHRDKLNLILSESLRNSHIERPRTLRSVCFMRMTEGAQFAPAWQMAFCGK